MKRILLGICTLLLLAGTQANADVVPFLTNGGVVDSTLNIGDDTWTVTNKNTDGDIWDAAAGGYIWDESAGNAYSGVYLGTFDGNDSEDEFIALASYYLSSTVDSSWYKTPSEDGEEGSLVITSTVFKDEDEAIAGTWTIGTSESPEYVSFYTVKAGPQFALYFVDPAAASGYWATKHMTVGQNSNVPKISHLSVLADPGAPIPEPGVTLLFGLGVLGFAGVTRRRSR
jgi:hypothetical protein